MTEPHACDQSCTRKTCKVFQREYMRRYREQGPQVRGSYNVTSKPAKPRTVGAKTASRGVPAQPKPERYYRNGSQWNVVHAMTLEEYMRQRQLTKPVVFVEARAS